MSSRKRSASAGCNAASSSVDLASRIRGSFIGLAVCDALGGPVEFKKRGEYPKHTEMTYNKTFDVAAGSWTDDTSTALCLAESLLQNNGENDIGDQVQRYIAWWQDGYLSVNDECFDIGALTQQVLDFWKKSFETIGYDKLRPGSQAARDALNSIQDVVDSDFSLEIFVKKNGEIAYGSPRAGNGSLMRIVPVALITRSDKKALSMARECSRTTHPHAICSDCCQIYVDIVRMALMGASLEQMAGTLCEYSMNEEIDSAIRDTLKQYKTVNDWKNKPEKEIRSYGYVLNGLEIAFWALCSTASFEAGAIRVVNLGFDTDTNGAIYGGLAGAYYGYDAIPERWLVEMQKMEVLEGFVERMIAHRNATTS